MRGWGVGLLILGVGSFILPMMGLQFRILSLFGDYSPIAGGVMAVAGLGMLAGSFLTGGSSSS